MHEPRTLAVISAGLSTPSSTRLLADRLAQATSASLEADGIRADIHTIELRDLAQDITNQMLTGFGSARLTAAIEAVTSADGVIAVTPIFTASYSGLFKSFIDILDPTSLIDMPVQLGATGGTERHSLALDFALRPLFAYLRASVAPTGVYAASGDWGGADTSTTALADRIDRAGAEFAHQLQSRPRAVAAANPFALPVGFDPSGGTAVV